MNRKLTALLLALVLVLSLAACGAKKEEKPAEQPEVETEAPETEPEVEVADPDVGVPAEPTEEPDVMPEMPAVDPNAPATPEVAPEASKPEAPAPDANKPVETPAQKPAAGGVDLNAFYTSLVDTYGENFPANMNLAEMQDMLDSFYPGLSGLATKQLMIYQPMMGAVVCEIALVEVENASDVETVKTIFQDRITAQVDGGAWYPESIEGWKSNSRVVANGNCVMLIAYSECDAVVDAFNGLF